MIPIVSVSKAFFGCITKYKLEIERSTRYEFPVMWKSMKPKVASTKLKRSFTFVFLFYLCTKVVFVNFRKSDKFKTFERFLWRCATLNVCKIHYFLILKLIFKELRSLQFQVYGLKKMKGESCNNYFNLIDYFWFSYIIVKWELFAFHFPDSSFF